MALAFFDMDRTLLRIDSGTSWMKFLHGRGEISNLGLLRTIMWGVKYKLAILDIESLASRLAMESRGEPVNLISEKARTWFEIKISSEVASAAREQVAEHQSRGDTVVLLTAATQFVAEPVALDTGIEHVLCSRLGIKGQYLSGTFDAFCHGKNKVPIAEIFAKERGELLENAWFYSDSLNDLPMLERVGNPVAINPDPRLRRAALKRGWDVRRWK